MAFKSCLTAAVELKLLYQFQTNIAWYYSDESVVKSKSCDCVINFDISTIIYL